MISDIAPSHIPYIICVLVAGSLYCSISVVYSARSHEPTSLTQSATVGSDGVATLPTHIVLPEEYFDAAETDKLMKSTLKSTLMRQYFDEYFDAPELESDELYVKIMDTYNFPLPATWIVDLPVESIGVLRNIKPTVVPEEHLNLPSRTKTGRIFKEAQRYGEDEQTGNILGSYVYLSLKQVNDSTTEMPDVEEIYTKIMARMMDSDDCQQHSTKHETSSVWTSLLERTRSVLFIRLTTFKFLNATDESHSMLFGAAAGVVGVFLLFFFCRSRHPAAVGFMRRVNAATDSRKMNEDIKIWIFVYDVRYVGTKGSDLAVQFSAGNNCKIMKADASGKLRGHMTLLVPDSADQIGVQLLKTDLSIIASKNFKTDEIYTKGVRDMFYKMELTPGKPGEKGGLQRHPHIRLRIGTGCPDLDGGFESTSAAEEKIGLQAKLMRLEAENVDLSENAANASLHAANEANHAKLACSEQAALEEYLAEVKSREEALQRGLTRTWAMSKIKSMVHRWRHAKTLDHASAAAAAARKLELTPREESSEEDSGGSEEYDGSMDLHSQLSNLGGRNSIFTGRKSTLKADNKFQKAASMPVRGKNARPALCLTQTGRAKKSTLKGTGTRSESLAETSTGLFLGVKAALRRKTMQVNEVKQEEQRIRENEAMHLAEQQELREEVEHMDADAYSSYELLQSEARRLSIVRYDELRETEAAQSQRERTASLESTLVEESLAMADCEEEVDALTEELKLFENELEQKTEAIDEANAMRLGLSWQLKTYEAQHDQDVAELSEELCDARQEMNAHMYDKMKDLETRLHAEAISTESMQSEHQAHMGDMHDEMRTVASECEIYMQHTRRLEDELAEHHGTAEDSARSGGSARESYKLADIRGRKTS